MLNKNKNIVKTLYLLALVLPLSAYADDSIISSIVSSNETVFFMALIFVLTIYLGHLNYSRFSIVHGPEILTTLGITGCFFGIALALLSFDANNVQKSIPLLLTGVKTAFWSSIAGVVGALYIRFLHHVRKSPIAKNPNDIKAASLDDVVGTMAALRNGLVGDEQGTLLSQIKLQRQESKDKLDELVGEFKNFAAHMVENNQKAIIEALKEVIKDFNEKLTEQFGENFKQLNQAVEKLVVWQAQYKDELDVIKDNQAQTASDLKLVSQHFTELVNKAERFSQISHDLQAQLDLMEKQKDTLFQQEKSLSEVLTTMKDVTPEFSVKVDTMLKELSSGISNIQSEMAQATKNLGVQFQSSNSEMKTLLTDTIKKSQDELSISLKEQVSTIKEGVITLDRVMQEELNKALETLGRQLASLSSKFVDDYAPLTDKLKSLVESSRRI